MLTQRDLNQIENLIEEKLEEKFRNYPTKDEFFGKMDEIMGELKAIREENEILVGRSSDHEDRIECLEKIHPRGRHASA